MSKTNDVEELLASTKRTNGDELRFSRCEFKGAVFLNLRIWYQDANGEMQPTRKGVTIRESEVDTIFSAFAQLLSHQ